MSGIAGILDLAGQRSIAPGVLEAMSAALAHRGPDGSDCCQEPGIGLAVRRLDTGLHGPIRSPLTAQDGTLAAVWQGRLGDTDVLARAWTGDAEHLLDRLHGPFALALWDRQKRLLLLARDRMGCAPLYWTRRGDWLLFASEIKALLASGLVPAEVDRHGIDNVVTLLGLPAARTCFRGVQAIPPGHYLLIQANRPLNLEPRRYWDLDYPERGGEDPESDANVLADRLEEVLTAAVQRNLDGAGPTASYVSGGLDCSTLVALASKVRRQPLPTYTIRIDDPRLDETARAQRAARASGSEPVVVPCSAAELAAAYPRLIHAAESPVSDASCAALLLLAERVRADGYRVVLAGDGADELFAGYVWFKVDRLLGLLDWLPGVRPSQWLRRLYLKWTAPHIPWSNVRRLQELFGGHNPWIDLHGLISLSRSRFYSAEMRESLGGRVAQEDLGLDLDRLRGRHPLNQALYVGAKVHLAGLLLQAKGDRVAMHSGVDLRHPFLDEAVVDFCTRLHPRWKLRRLRDKYLLRLMASRYLPPEITRRPKSDFIAPFDSVYGAKAPPFVDQLLSEESLRRTGYFDPAAVRLWRERYPSLRVGSKLQLSVGIGLTAVVGTQLWHQTFIEGGLADLTAPGVRKAALIES